MIITEYTWLKKYLVLCVSILLTDIRNRTRNVNKINCKIF